MKNQGYDGIPDASSLLESGFMKSPFRGASRRFVWLCLCVIAIFLCIPHLQSQGTFGAITGTATDSSGSIVPNVKVTVTNERTNQAHSATTDDRGNYVATNLSPSTYSVVGEAPGFSKFENRNITLAAQQELRIDLKLKLGAVGTEVAVTAAVPVVESEGPTIAATLTDQVLRDTSTNLRSVATPYGDSGIFNFIFLTPTGYQSGGFRFSLGGARGSEFNFNVDGISSNAPGFGNVYGTLQPSFESIEEVRYEMVNNKAEFAQVANVTTVTKSGGNALHGGLLWFHYNSALAARSFFSPSVGQNILNDFGGYVGGPVKKDKLFYFFNYEGDRQRTPAIVSPSLPTADMRTGNFSQLLNQATPVVITNPYTNAPFPSNIIPASLLSSASLKWQQQFYPLPNYGSANSFVGNFRADYPQAISHNSYNGRADYAITPNNNFYARYFYKVSLPGLLPGQLPPSITGYNEQRRTSQQVALSDTWSLGPNLVNEMKAGFARDYNHGGGTLFGQQIVTDLGIQGVPPAPSNVPNIPSVSVSGFTSAAVQGQFSYASNTYQYYDQLTYVRGSHTMKAGIEFRRMQFDALNFPRFGSYSFTGGITGFSYADFLLGLPQTTTRNYLGPSEYARLWYLMGFAQDDWKLSRRLTLSYGLRYDYNSPSVDKYDAVANFDPATGSLVVPTAAAIQRFVPAGFPSNVPIITAQQAGFPTRSLRNNYTKAYQPRLGFAFRPFADAKTVVRGGYGIFNDELNADIFSLLYGAPFGLTQSFVNKVTSGQPLLTFQNPFVGQAGVGAVVANALATNIRNPYTQQWNLTIERDLGFGTGLRVSYIGLKSTNLLYGRDINQVPASTIPFDATRRPYANYQAIYMYSNGGNLSYNALSTEVNKKWNKGLMFQTSYTWAKSLTDVDETADVEAGTIIENSYNRSREKGNSLYAPRHRVIGNVIWELPFGPDKPMLNSHSLASRLIGGWQLSSSVVAQTGNYLTPTFSGSDPSNTQTFGGRASVVGDWHVPSGQQSINNWFNPAAFTVPAAGNFGNAGYGTIVGPGHWSVNSALFKSFKLTDRLNLRFQASFTNVFNHPNFGNPNLNISFPTAAGVITSANTQDFAGPRQGQVGLRLDF
jgi:hypothetical protein